MSHPRHDTLCRTAVVVECALKDVFVHGSKPCRQDVARIEPRRELAFTLHLVGKMNGWTKH